MHNVTEAVWKSRLKIIWSTTREGWGRCGQKRSEKTVATRGYGEWNSRGTSKDRRVWKSTSYISWFCSGSNLTLKYLAMCEVSHQETKERFLSLSWIFFTSWDFCRETGHSSSLKWYWESRGTWQEPSRERPCSQQKELSANWPKLGWRGSHATRKTENPQQSRYPNKSI